MVGLPRRGRGHGRAPAADPRPGAAGALRRAQRARHARAAAAAGAGAGRPLPRHARPPMRVLCLGMDGADHGLVGELLEQGRLPTLAGHHPRRRLRAAALDPPRRHADRMVVVPDRPEPRPARHLQLLDERQPGAVAGRERPQPRGRPALAHAGRRRDPLGVRDGAVHLPGRGDRRGSSSPATAGRPRRRSSRRPPPRCDPRPPSRPRHRPPPDAGALLGGLRPLRAAADRARRPGRVGVRAVLRARARPGRARGRLHEHRLRRPPRLRPARPAPPRARPRGRPATSWCRCTRPSTPPAAA